MNDHLYRFAHSSNIYTPFANEYGCGWFDGGCFIFARALQLWLGGRLAVIVRKELVREQAFDHVVLSLSDPQHVGDTLYLDADGASSAHTLLNRWRTRERLPDAILEDPASRTRFLPPLWKESWSAWLARHLEAKFGKPTWPELAGLLGQRE
ncbi:MAG TPA: hypothetical protein VFK06_17845 [Candidatus Angelobacter sp.]|nr:hypothetical protein [Candidatus Angelobacter sp.]